MSWGSGEEAGCLVSGLEESGGLGVGVCVCVCEVEALVC